MRTGILVGVLALAAAASAMAQESRVFVTSTSTFGLLGGVAGGDNICTTRAAAGGLAGGVWVAWLSDSGVNAVDRITASGPFVRAVSGVTIANNVADLTDGTLDNAISDDEFGNPIDVNVWTGTTTAGVLASDTCDDWTSDTSGVRGNSPDTAGTWTEDDPEFCDVDLNLYCFENPAPVPALPKVAFAALALVLLGGTLTLLTLYSRP